MEQEQEQPPVEQPAGNEDRIARLENAIAGLVEMQTREFEARAKAEAERAAKPPSGHSITVQYIDRLRDSQEANMKAVVDELSAEVSRMIGGRSQKNAGK